MTRFQKYIKQVEEGDKGFTLIELMVVVLIIGILMAIAIPTFLGAKNGANARAAQSNITNAVTAEQAQYSQNQAYSADTTVMGSAEPALAWNTYSTTGTESGGNNVYVAVDSSAPYNDLTVSAFGADGNCYFAVDNQGKVAYGQEKPATAGVCSTSDVSNWYGSFQDAASKTNPLSAAPSPIP